MKYGMECFNFCSIDEPVYLIFLALLGLRWLLTFFAIPYLL